MEKHTQIALKMDRLQLVSRALRRRKLREVGLWRGQMPILEYVLEHEGCTQSALAAALGLSAATVAVSTKRLAAAGLLTKEADGENLRCNRLFVTDAGREKLLAGKLVAKEHNEALFSVLTDEEQQTLCALFDKLLSQCEERGVAPSPLDNYILQNQLESEETK